MFEVPNSGDLLISQHETGCFECLQQRQTDRLLSDECVQIADCCVNEIWKKSSTVVVRTARRLITFGLAVALILVLCEIHSLCV